MTCGNKRCQSNSLSIAAIVTACCLAGCGHQEWQPTSPREPSPLVISPPLPPDVVAAWTKAGGQIGAVSIPDGTDHRTGGYSSTTEPKRAGEIPAFRFHYWEHGVTTNLPHPSIPFGLEIYELTDADVSELAGLENLRMLELFLSSVTGEGFSQLAGLKELQSVSFNQNDPRHGGLTDAGLKEVAKIKALRTVELSHTNITDAGLKELAALTNLHALSVTATRVSDTGAEYLSTLENLYTLRLNHTNVSSMGLQALVALKHLRTLSLVANGITDADLTTIARMDSLKELDLRGNPRITDAGIAALRTALPNLEIDRRPLRPISRPVRAME
jgi:internalin A